MLTLVYYLANFRWDCLLVAGNRYDQQLDEQ